MQLDLIVVVVVVSSLGLIEVNDPTATKTKTAA